MTRSVANEQKILSRGVRFRQILQALQALATCSPGPPGPGHLLRQISIPCPATRSSASGSSVPLVRAGGDRSSSRVLQFGERADDGVERGEAHRWAARGRRWSTLPAGRRCPWCKLPRWLDAPAAERRRDRRRRRVPVAVPSLAGAWSGTCLSCRGQLAPRSNHCRGSRTTGRGGSPGCRRAGGRTPQTRGSRQRKSPGLARRAAGGSTGRPAGRAAASSQRRVRRPLTPQPSRGGPTAARGQHPPNVALLARRGVRGRVCGGPARATGCRGGRAALGSGTPAPPARDRSDAHAAGPSCRSRAHGPSLRPRCRSPDMPPRRARVRVARLIGAASRHPLAGPPSVGAQPA